MIARAALGTAAAMAAAEMAAAARKTTTAATTPATATSRGRLRTTFSPQTSAVTTVWERLQLHQGSLFDNWLIRPGVAEAIL